MQAYFSIYLEVVFCKWWWFIISEVHSVLNYSLFAENVFYFWIALCSSPCAYYVGLHLPKVRLCTLLEVLMLVPCFVIRLNFQFMDANVICTRTSRFIASALAWLVCCFVENVSEASVTAMIIYASKNLWAGHPCYLSLKNNLVCRQPVWSDIFILFLD
jgi:hypothetical protein